MESTAIAVSCPICSENLTETDEGYCCWVCLREFLIKGGKLTEVKTSIYQ